MEGWELGGGNPGGDVGMAYLGKTGGCALPSAVEGEAAVTCPSWSPCLSGHQDGLIAPVSCISMHTQFGEGLCLVLELVLCSKSAPTPTQA